MTISFEEPGIWVVVCDKCGERVILDIPDEDEDFTPADAAEEEGFVPDPQESYIFESGYRKYREEYATHKCEVCAS